MMKRHALLHLSTYLLLAAIAPPTLLAVADASTLPDRHTTRRPTLILASNGGFVFNPTSGGGGPRQSSGTATRSPRATQLAAVKALLPPSLSGTTIAAHPTILAYVPRSAAKTALFRLTHEANQVIYQARLPLSGQAGILTIPLPKTAPALAIGQSYQWDLVLEISDHLAHNKPQAKGWIQRIPVPPTLAIQADDPVRQALTLCSQGIWYDCVAILAALRSAQPQDPTLQQHWAELLTSVGLQDLQPMAFLPAPSNSLAR